MHIRWERPFLDPDIFTIITKSLTFLPRKGNFRWWKFWKTFRINKHYTINALDLPNPGYAEWIISIFPKIKHKNIVPSICPFNKDEARLMALSFNELDIRTIEINISCPTVEQFNPIEIISTQNIQ